MVEHGNHPDIHWLRPEGPGGQVVIGGPEARFRGVRDLISELALLPVEGGARVAIIERADRMNDDAQSALLKTLEEPPPGVTIVLCANDEERLLPTVRSRCARVRLGPVGPRAIEEILAEHDLADAAAAARLGRLAGGRPGVRSRMPGRRRPRRSAASSRASCSISSTRALPRLAAARALVARERPRAILDRGARGDDDLEQAGRISGGRPGQWPDGGQKRAPAAERRRGAAMLLSVWVDVARDLALVGAGERSSLRDPGLLEDLEGVARHVPATDVAAFLDRLARAGGCST